MTASAAARASILFVLPSLQGGGAERVIVTLLRHLDRARFTPALAVLDGRAPAFLDDLPSDVEYLDLGTVRARRSLWPLLKLIRHRRPAVVLSAIGHMNLALALLRPFLPRETRLVARETNVLTQLLAHQRWARLWELGYRWLYRWCDRIVCQSRFMQQEMASHFGLGESRTIVIANPVEIERARLLAQQPPAVPLPDRDGQVRLLVAAGRLSHEKGFDLLVEAIALLGDPRYRLMILGEGPERPALEARIAELGLQDQVRLVGFQANPCSFYARADAMVLSSRFDMFPNAVLEALACGLPVVATPAPGGIREILEGRPGCRLATEVSAASLAQALRDFPYHQPVDPATFVMDQYEAKVIAGLYGAMFDAIRSGGRAAE